MNKDLIFDILNYVNEAIIAIDFNGKVLYWNCASEKLFGYKSSEVLGKYIPIISLQSRYEIDYAIEQAKNRRQISFRTSKKDKFGNVLDLIFISNPIIKNNNVAGVSILVQETNLVKKICYLPIDIGEPTERDQKRTFLEIRNLILVTLLNNKKTINQIANDSGINWRTVEKHLTYLIGKRLVNEVLSSKYVRIFELIEAGRIYVDKLMEEEEKRLFKKE